MLIRTHADLSAVMREQSLLHPLRRPAVLIDLPQLPPNERADWGSRLERLRSQCGCTAAMIGLGAFTLASILYVLVLALQTTTASEPDYPTITLNGALFLFGLILSALTGKTIGLAVAALRFRQTCRALQLRLKALQAQRPSEMLRAAPAPAGRPSYRGL